MNRKFLISLCIPAWLFAACSTDREETAPTPNDGYLELTFTRLETRADLEDDGSGTFTEGDKIGLFIDNGTEIQYRELAYSSGSWQPRLKRAEFGDGALRLAAHYPADAADREDPEQAEFHVAENQTASGFAATDLLFAQKTLDAGNYRADMRFSHALHRLRIRIANAEETTAVKVRSTTSGTVNLLTGETVPDKNQYGWIEPRPNGAGTFEAVIFPQETAPYQSGDGLLKITSGEREIVYLVPETIEGTPFTEFEAGKQTTIRLSVKEEPSDLANKTLWVYGVNAPDFPGKENVPIYPSYQETFPMGEWFRNSGQSYENQYLTWSEDCGWYDCNKSMNYDEDDGNLCWAASASNLLIWWMVHNKAYIEAYDKEFDRDVTSPSTGRLFERPEPEFKPLYFNGETNRAPVFEFFKGLFNNRTSWNTAGVNWFITGNTDLLASSSKITGFPGFFHGVFPQKTAIAVDSPQSPNSKQFNDFIIDALLNRKALGFNVYDYAGKGTGNHAMTIWGAEFDENGMVSHIYYCDNNLSNQDANGAMILRRKIVYITDSSIPELGTTEYTYLQRLDAEDGSPQAKAKITRLCAVDLRQDIWAAKYPSVGTDK